MGILHNPRHEKFSQLVASGIKPKEAYTSVGYKPTGAKQAASRLLTKADVRERVSELQENAARSSVEATILNRERVLNRLAQFSSEAEKKGQYSVAVRCEELIGKELGMFVDRSVNFNWDGDPSTLNDAQLEKLTQHLERIALGDDRARIEAVRRRARLEAGPVVDVEPVPAGLGQDEW